MGLIHKIFTFIYITLLVRNITSLITVEQGQLRGTIKQDYKGGKFYSFQGIPYAKPPIGSLRFKAPIPKENWVGVLDATKPGKFCPQYDDVKKTLIGSEDCLNLNVYTKDLLNNTEKTLKPVLVFIHGGGFASGSGDPYIYGPEFLLTEDIVLVTINYRLGIFGFLSFDDATLGVPGNAGLKDMVLALKWIKKNIDNFCGDPTNVTIFGESAGAVAVHYLMLSQKAKGLFHKAILQSGVVFTPSDQGKFFSEEACKTAGLVDTSDLGKCLRQLKEMSLESLFEIQTKLSPSLDPNYQPYFAPTVEKITSKLAFINKPPLEIIKSGNYNQVPMIIGFNSVEGLFFETVRNNPRIAIFKDVEASIPHSLKYEKGSKESQAVAKKITKFYLKNKNILEANPEGIYDLQTDVVFLTGIIGTIKHHLKTSKFPIYFYKVTVESSLNFIKQLFNLTTSGVSHADDIGYLFKTFITPEKIEPGSLEDVSIKNFVKLWTNMARFGNPTPPNGTFNLLWKSVEKNALYYLNIGKELKLEMNPEVERIQFWREIFNNNTYLADFL